MAGGTITDMEGKNSAPGAPREMAPAPGKNRPASAGAPAPGKNRPAQAGREPAPDAGGTAGAPQGQSTEFSPARRHRRARHVRRFVLLAVLLAAMLAWVTGLFSASLAAAEDLIDSARISMLPSASFPQETGIADLFQLEELSGGFVELGAENCVVYSAGGNRLRSVQPGYAYPAISAGSTRFLIYNRAGSELRVESRTQTLYTKSYESSILLAAMSRGGSFAVATEDSRYLARLMLYSSSMTEQLSWAMTEAEGTPIRMAYASDSRRLAVATLAASEGQVVSRLFVLDARSDSEVKLAEQPGSVPLGLRWLSAREILVLYDNGAIVYSASDGTQKAVYSYGGQSLLNWSECGTDTALLLTGGAGTQAVVLDKGMQVTAGFSAPSAVRLTLTRTAVYVLTDTAVQCCSRAGVYQWQRDFETQPLAVLDSRQLLVFTASSADVLQQPAA